MNSKRSSALSYARHHSHHPRGFEPIQLCYQVSVLFDDDDNPGQRQIRMPSVELCDIWAPCFMQPRGAGGKLHVYEALQSFQRIREAFVKIGRDRR